MEPLPALLVAQHVYMILALSYPARQSNIVLASCLDGAWASTHKLGTRAETTGSACPSLDAHRLISFAGVCTQVVGKPAGIERGGSADVAAAHPGVHSVAEPAGVSGRLAPTRSCNVGAAAAHGLLAGTQLSLSAELAASAARNGAYLNLT